MILDNADDNEFFFKPHATTEGRPSVSLANYLPRRSNGFIIITTRDERVGERLTDREKSIIISPLEVQTAHQLLRSKVLQGKDWAEENALELLDLLGYLPLAIT